jgi:pimeloyl-ACP methyl ester carboxylesterase
MRQPSPTARTTTRVPIATLLALTLATAVACTRPAPQEQAPAPVAASAAEAAQAPPVQKPAWKGCGGAFQCARLRVPLDYAKPGGQAIELALIRIPARKPGSRIGSLVVNPGGPGGSGVEFVRATATGFYGAPLRDRFDIVGFDPRGVGDSAPVHCQSDREKDQELVTADAVPENAAERAEMISGARRFAEGCARSSARVLPYLSTEAAARDLDVLRAALGDDRLTYLGISYGSVLGATYASMFPRRVRAMTLDAAVDPQVWINQPEETVRRQAQGFEHAFDAFLADCRARGADCGFGNGDPGRAYDRLIKRLDHHPIRAKGSGDRRRITGYVAFLAVNAALYNRVVWPQLADALELADEEDDGSELLTLADSINGRRSDGTYDNLNDANASINCVDEVNPTDVAAYDRLSDELGRSSPRFGRAFGYARLVCAYWPARAVERYTGPFRADGAPPILVVGTTGDPAAPYAWARSLAGQLASGVLLTWRGVNHGAYGGMSACIDDAVNRYLVDGTPPTNGKTC